MTRPTREQVDAALKNSGLVYAFSAEEWRVMTVRLTAEVRALREELAKESAAHTEARLDLLATRRSLGDLRQELEASDEHRDLLEATIARVEALVEEFRTSTLSDGFGPLGAAGNRALDMAADALEAALKGET